jgi:hypothetical protein
MDAGLGTPLLEMFRRGEVARDVRLLAARGQVATRAVEQLAILAMLTGDDDPEVRDAAEQTIGGIPGGVLAAFVARPEVPADLRTFVAARGVPTRPPAVVPPAPANLVAAVDANGAPGEGDEPLLQPLDGDLEALLAGGSNEAETAKRLEDMTVPEKVKAAMKGSREMRATLVRDPNKLVARAVLSSPRLTDTEIEAFAKMQNVSEDVLRVIGTTRAWVKNYNVALALVRNAKCPVALSMTLLPRLVERDVKVVSQDRNVPEPLRIAARKKLAKDKHG